MSDVSRPIRAVLQLAGTHHCWAAVIAINRLHGDFASLSSTNAYGIDPMGGGHTFRRSLYQLVMPRAQIAGEMCGHYVLSR